MDKTKRLKDLIDFSPAERVEIKIYLIQVNKVILDKNWVEVYGVETWSLN